MGKTKTKNQKKGRSTESARRVAEAEDTFSAWTDRQEGMRSESDVTFSQEEVKFLHYILEVVPVGMSRGVKKLMQEKFPNMSNLEDINKLLIKGVSLSESEAEQNRNHNITELPQVYSEVSKILYKRKKKEAVIREGPSS